VLATGGAGLVIGAGAVIAFGRDWAVQALAQASPPSAALMIGAVGAICGMGLAAQIIILRVRAQYRLVRSALNNMTQGLCMFDSAARLILCN